MGRSTILVVSCNPVGCEPLLTLLRSRRCWPVLLSNIQQATAVAQDGSVALVILNGSQEFCTPFFRFFSELQSRQAAAPLIIVASESSEAFAVASLRIGARDYLAEPLDLAAFAQSISRWFPENPAPFPDTSLTGGEVFVGNSPAMQALRLHIRRVAATDCNVLITGETGTGKELVAQLIHQNSTRRGHPLVCINCAAIPDSLLESELFGYERGAFTGANAMSQGKLMSANNGTVFFDEIGDMSPQAQAKILRAIESKEVQRLGARRRYETDVRIMAATHHNLDELASAETFRRDLYFRLNVGRIHLPPLRERKADIAGLVERMVADLNHRLGRHIEGANDQTIQALVQHDWPGNVRELRNIVERIFITRDCGRITEEDLPFEFQRSSAKSLTAPCKEGEELGFLRAALVTCNGNKSKAAERLNWSRMTLYRKMAKYKLDCLPAKTLTEIGKGDEFDLSKQSA